MWSVYPLVKESQNGTALQDYSRQVGFPQLIKTDNTQIKLEKLTHHFRQHFIEQTTTETHYQ